ncbi:hypothetical protein E2986_12528, partial [Frieseomelitta varia]
RNRLKRKARNIDDAPPLNQKARGPHLPLFNIFACFFRFGGQETGNERSPRRNTRFLTFPYNGGKNTMLRDIRRWAMLDNEARTREMLKESRAFFFFFFFFFFSSFFVSNRVATRSLPRYLPLLILCTLNCPLLKRGLESSQQSRTSSFDNCQRLFAGYVVFFNFNERCHQQCDDII